MVHQEIPKGQKDLIQRALQSHREYLSNLPYSQSVAYDTFDSRQLEAIMDYKIVVELSEDCVDKFAMNHGVDFPNYDIPKRAVVKSKRKFKVVTSVTTKTAPLVEMFEIDLNGILNDDSEVAYALQEMIDEVLDIPQGCSMYFKPNRDDIGAKGMLIRIN